MSQPTTSHNEKVRRGEWTMDEKKNKFCDYILDLLTSKRTRLCIEQNYSMIQIKDEVEAELNIPHHAQGSPQPNEEPSTAMGYNNSEAKNEAPVPDCESVWVSNCKRHLIEYREEANEAICDDLTEQTDLEEIHLRVYCAASTTIEQSDLKINTEANSTHRKL
ncbi:hypothetical protein HHI36_022431 [Cryptolaemus montrouzieri]|uniref:Uncharacterized protein n=1 Tax=Cryptolaemus montrouzieri TaxID=559131 RepID=A0ABD2N0L2_9CUCU